jgi:hypothetical protein
VRAAQPTTRAPRANAAPRPAQRTRRVLTTCLGVVRVCGRSRSAACRALDAAAASCPDPRAAGFRCSDANADGAQSRSRTQCARDCARCRTRRLVFPARYMLEELAACAQCGRRVR